MTTRQESAEVLYATQSTVAAALCDLDSLKQVALGSQKKRARICLHLDKHALLQEMMIVLTRDGYVQPHKHLNRIESFSVLQGEVDVVLFNDAGIPLKIIQMGAPSSGKPCYLRIGEPVVHGVFVRSEFVVVHEVTLGPFDPSDTIFAPWSPAQGNPERIQHFLDQFRRVGE